MTTGSLQTPAQPGERASDRIGPGIGFELISVICFSLVDGLAKWLGQDYPAVQIVFFRYFFGLLPVAVFVWRAGGLSSLRTRRLPLHMLRACLLFVALLLFFQALQSLPLAEAIAVAFTAPLFVTALAGPMLGETVDLRRWGAVALGFLGALIMVRPGSATFRPEALLVLGSALAFSLLVTLTRRMTRTPRSSKSSSQGTSSSSVSRDTCDTFGFRERSKGRSSTSTPPCSHRSAARACTACASTGR